MEEKTNVIEAEREGQRETQRAAAYVGLFVERALLDTTKKDKLRKVLVESGVRARWLDAAIIAADAIEWSGLDSREEMLRAAILVQALAQAVDPFRRAELEKGLVSGNFYPEKVVASARAALDVLEENLVFRIEP